MTYESIKWGFEVNYRIWFSGFFKLYFVCFSFFFHNFLPVFQHTRKLMTAKCEIQNVIISLRAATMNDGLYSHSTIKKKKLFPVTQMCWAQIAPFSRNSLLHPGLSTLKAFEASCEWEFPWQIWQMIATF